MVEGIGNFEGKLTPNLSGKEVEYLKNLNTWFFVTGADKEPIYTATELVSQGRCELLKCKLKSKNEG